MLIQASHILPIDGPLLAPGFIRVEGNQITEIGPLDLLDTKNLPKETIQLEATLLLPGFVNAHCHLELTSLGSFYPIRHFVSWIKEIAHRKNNLDPKKIKKGIEIGINHLMNSGVTTIGDHVSFNMDWKTIVLSPLRGRLFGEVLGVLPEVCQDIYSHLKNIKKELESKKTLFTLNISPHSVHAVHPLVLEEVIRNEPPPLSCHLAESQSEDDYFKRKGGELMRFMTSRGFLASHQGMSGLQFIKDHKLPLSKILIIHGNYLDKTDLKIIAEESLSIVHCPGSHEYFDHRVFPLKDYLNKNINIALGTDSIASNTQLNFLLELRRVRKNFPEISLEAILKMATFNGAKALQMEDEIGSLTPGKKADIIGFKTETNIPPEEIPFKADKASFVMIDGKRLL